MIRQEEIQVISSLQQEDLVADFIKATLRTLSIQTKYLTCFSVVVFLILISVEEANNNNINNRIEDRGKKMIIQLTYSLDNSPHFYSSYSWQQ